MFLILVTINSSNTVKLNICISSQLLLLFILFEYLIFAPSSVACAYHLLFVQNLVENSAISSLFVIVGCSLVRFVLQDK